MDSDQTNLTPLVAPDEESTLRLASEIAAANLLFAQQELGARIVDPTITTKALLDIAEHSFKVSGMAKKQEVKSDGGTGFSIVINFPDGSNAHLDKPDPSKAIDVTPQRLVDDARPLINWATSPEFSEATS